MYGDGGRVFAKNKIINSINFTFTVSFSNNLFKAINCISYKMSFHNQSLAHDTHLSGYLNCHAPL